MLVGDEEPVDTGGGKLEWRRRHEPVVVRADPWVDHDATAVRLEAEPGLAEPRRAPGSA